MFIGHYALALGSRKQGKLPSLAIMFIAVQFMDLLWPVLVLLDIEKFEIDPGNTALTPLNFSYYPYSHSLFMSIVWAILFGLIYNAFRKNKKGAILLAFLVFSHWILDFITHRPDLPISPFSDFRVGLGLWNMPAVAIALETAMFLAGTAIYVRAMEPQRKFAFWSLIVFFLLVHFMNLLGPPPPSVTAVAWSANLMWLFVLWAWWVEKKRKPI
jgi:membrane-bound metal-dependent hydrolase YbcI (DUF457 family)